MEEAFLAIARRYGLGGPDAPPIFVQCFEPEPLREMRRLGSALPQIFLLDDDAAPRDRRRARRDRGVRRRHRSRTSC